MKCTAAVSRLSMETDWFFLVWMNNRSRKQNLHLYSLSTCIKKHTTEKNETCYPASWQMAQLRAFPEPPGRAPIGISIAFLQSSLSIKPFNTFKHYTQQQRQLKIKWSTHDQLSAVMLRCLLNAAKKAHVSQTSKIRPSPDTMATPFQSSKFNVLAISRAWPAYSVYANHTEGC